MTENFKIQPFENLPTSTATVMVYANITFNLMNIFRHIPITYVDPPLTKKKKNIDKKTLEAPYGSIISLQHGVYIRGIRMSKKKKYWCPVCQPVVEGTEESRENSDKILTVEEFIRPVSKDERSKMGLPPKTFKIHFMCTECEREFEITQLRKIVPFLNQVTIVVSIGHVIVNAMMFKDNLKLAGNRSFQDAVEVIMILWEDYITPIPEGWSFRTIKSEKAVTDVHFLFELVMRNVDFQLGFPIDKKKLNRLMNRKEYKDRVFLSQCETTSATHVNIKMHAEKPTDFKFDVLVYDKGGTTNPHFVQMTEKRYARKKSPKDKPITFIVFSSAEIILTGRYDKSMKDQYEFFVQTTNKHREEIEEIINKPKMSIREYLKTLEDK